MGVGALSSAFRRLTRSRPDRRRLGEARAKAWHRENAAAIAEYNAFIAANGIPDEALAHSKTSLLASDALENQSNRSMAQTCAINTLLGLGPLHHEENARRIEALTPDDIRAVAARLFASREPVIATVLPRD